MARLYADENFDFPAVVALRQLGHDVLRVQDVGLDNLQIPDRDVLAYAIRLDRAVVTFDRVDFMKLHRLVKPHGGIIVCTHDVDYQALAARIDQAIASLADLTNQLLRIIRPAKP